MTDGPGRWHGADPSGGAPLAARIRALTRVVPDFPEDGVQFADLSPLLADPVALAMVVDALRPVAGVDLIAGVDARGFLLASAVALRCGTGVLAVRKGGKLPPPVLSCSYDLEYGSATLEVPTEGVVLRGRRIEVLDDVLATGGTLRAAVDLLRRAGAHVTGAAVLLEVPGLGGRERLDDLPLRVLAPGTP